MNTDYIDIVLLHCMTDANWTEKLKGRWMLSARRRPKVTSARRVLLPFVRRAAGAAASPWVEVDLARINPFGAVMDVDKPSRCPRCRRCCATCTNEASGLRH